MEELIKHLKLIKDAVSLSAVIGEVSPVAKANLKKAIDEAITMTEKYAESQLKGFELPSLEDAGIIAVGMSEKLTPQEQSFFIAGFQECIKYITKTSGENEKYYEIDFDGNVNAKIVIRNGKIKIIAAMNGYGNSISVDKIDIKNLQNGK